MKSGHSWTRRNGLLSRKEYFAFTGIWPSEAELDRVNNEISKVNMKDVEDNLETYFKPLRQAIIRPKKQPPAAENVAPKFINCFLPKGRSASVIYLVQVRDHPGVVKIGRTTKWNQRRKSYENWNLRAGDGIIRERTFVFTEEFVDLPALEKYLILSMPYEKAFGEEWFFAEFDEAVEHVENLVTETRLSFL